MAPHIDYGYFEINRFQKQFFFSNNNFSSKIEILLKIFTQKRHKISNIITSKLFQISVFFRFCDIPSSMLTNRERVHLEWGVTRVLKKNFCKFNSFHRLFISFPISFDERNSILSICADSFIKVPYCHIIQFFK